jgi:hypothetical protein
MKILTWIFVLFGTCFYSGDSLENKSLEVLNDSRNGHPMLAGKKIRIDPLPASTDADIGILIALINGKSLIQGYDNESNSVKYKIYKNQIKLNVPTGLQKRCLAKHDFEGKVFNVIEIGEKKYVEVKLENKNSEIFYFIFEYDHNGIYQKYYHQYLIY